MHPDDEIATRLDRLEMKVDEVHSLIISQRAVKQTYSTEEAAAYLKKAEFTVREWCHHGRIHARKKGSGRGRHMGWAIDHAELLRYQREGLLPL